MGRPRCKISRIQADGMIVGRKLGWPIRKIASYVDLPYSTVQRWLNDSLWRLSNPQVLFAVNKPPREPRVGEPCPSCGGKIDSETPTYCAHCHRVNESMVGRIRPTPIELRSYWKAWKQAHPEDSDLKGGR